MATDLGRRFNVDYAALPPHMSPEDYAIWLRYRPIPQGRGALALYFDVGLGAGQIAPADASPELREMWRRLNQKRADVIIEYDDHVDLIELRDHAGPNALGRLSTYRLLLTADNPLNKPITTTLVTNLTDPDVAATAAALSITYLII